METNAFIDLYIITSMNQKQYYLGDFDCKGLIPNKGDIIKVDDNLVFEVSKREIDYKDTPPHITLYVRDIALKKKEKWLTWLEKQGKSSDQIHYWTEEEIEPIIHDYLRGVEHYGGMIGRLRCLKPKSIEKQGSSSVKWQKNTLYNKPAINHSVLMKTTQSIAEGEWQGEHWFQYRWSWTLKDSDVLAWMELSNLSEQGEQKTAVTDFNAKDWYVSKVDGKIHDMTYNPADKVEPKFKIGDWITDGEAIFHVIDYIEHVYQLVTQSGTSFHFSDVNVENKYHLWTIADAKDGDVIVDKSDGTIGIFESIGHHPDGGSFNDPSYCFLHCRYDDGYFFADFEDGNMMTSDDVIPAIKEQSDILFTEMKEAGYEWNAEKKELKKIHVIDDGKAEMDYCFTKMMAGEKVSPAWSDEDENYLQSAENACEYQYGKNTSTILWLKSLKDRVQPQPKQEWSEEDEKIALSIEQVMNCASLLNLVPEKIEKVRAWLKHLKDRIGG